MAEEVGFEPTQAFRPLEVFKTTLFDRLSTPPYNCRFYRERQNPVLDGWVVPHIGFTTNNHRQYPPFRRFMLFFQLSPSQPVDCIKP